MSKIRFSLIAPLTGVYWSAYTGASDSSGLPYEQAIAYIAKHVDEMRRQGARGTTLWIRTRDTAERGSSPVIWCYTGSVREGKKTTSRDGPGNGAFCIGFVPVSQLMETVEAHARMMT